MARHMRNPYEADPALHEPKRKPKRKRTVLLKPGQRKKRKAERKAQRFTSMQFDHCRRLRFRRSAIPSGYEPIGDSYDGYEVDLPYYLAC